MNCDPVRPIKHVSYCWVQGSKFTGFYTFISENLQVRNRQCSYRIFIHTPLESPTPNESMNNVQMWTSNVSHHIKPGNYQINGCDWPNTDQNGCKSHWMAWGPDASSRTNKLGGILQGSQAVLLLSLQWSPIEKVSLTDPLVKPDCLLPCQSLSQDLKNVLPVLFLLMKMMAQTTKTMKL